MKEKHPVVGFYTQPLSVQEALRVIECPITLQLCVYYKGQQKTQLLDIHYCDVIILQTLCIGLFPSRLLLHYNSSMLYLCYIYVIWCVMLLHCVA